VEISIELKMVETRRFINYPPPYDLRRSHIPAAKAALANGRSRVSVPVFGVVFRF
jgi:hypothetical protein